MVFSSQWFLFAFLPLCVASYFLVPARAKNVVLLFWSYAFYAWGAPKVVLVLMVTSAFDYLLAKHLSATEDPQRKKKIFHSGLALNLLLLGYYKYANFFVEELGSLLSLFGFDSPTWTTVALPIGISFFTFQKISYLADVYSERVRPAENFVQYALYVAMFPQLIAGPIIRYHDIAKSLRTRAHSLELVFSGIVRFTFGLGKKVLLADPLGHVADNIFAVAPSELTTGYAWIGILCYSFQIYYDFSAYSDMAIGLGRIFGFQFRENFNLPYISQTITEFWRRWHISLSDWMKEYLYIPLGGNRVSNSKTYINLWIVFLCSGFWHGASWTFVFWGAYHGFFLVLDRMLWSKIAARLPTLLNIALTFLIVMIGWVFFRADDFPYALQFIALLFGFESGAEEFRYYRAALIHNRGIAVLVFAVVASFLSANGNLRARASSWWEGRTQTTSFVLQACVVIPLFVLSIVSLAALTYSPFLYFRF